MSFSSNAEIDRAISLAKAKADADPLRPTYHFHPPAQWMNDPNGTCYADGWYHVFYQHNPFNDWWDHMHWGHARTRDFVHWEYLPIALYPDNDPAEGHCFSGCCVVRSSHDPLIFYTSVAKNRDEKPNRQRVAIGSRDLLTWQKLAVPAVQISDAPAGTKNDWRDPYVFEHDGRSYMVVGAVIPYEGTSRASTLLFEAEDETLLRWRYRGLLFVGDPSLSFLECPNFFSLEGRWVHLYSPREPVQYHTGRFFPETGALDVELSGLVDHSSEYYATNTIRDDRGRTILLGWVRGFPKGHGWNGCHAIPRELKMDRQGRLVQAPIAETEELRTHHRVEDADTIRRPRTTIPCAPSGAMEIAATLAMAPGSELSISLQAGERSLFSIQVDHASMRVEGLPVPFERDTSSPREGTLRVFLDRSVVEIFADNGRHCVTRVIEDLLAADRIVFGRKGAAEIKSLESWEMAPLSYSVPDVPVNA